MSTTRVCICCGERYEYCPTCRNVESPTWKRLYDCNECKEIAHMYQFSRGEGGIPLEYAKKEMKKYPNTLKKIFKYNSLMANAIKDMFGVTSNVDEIDNELDNKVQQDNTAIESEASDNISDDIEVLETDKDNKETKKSDSNSKRTKHYNK